MTAIPHRDNNGDAKQIWTMEALQEHNQAIDALKDRLDTERDRRYSEVNIEREKALKIKEEADKAALGLAREIQSYKDEKANQLREQIQSERGSLASKDDLASAIREIQTAIAPLTAYVSGMGGQAKQTDASRTNIVAVVGVIYGIMATAGVLVSVLALMFRH